MKILNLDKIETRRDVAIILDGVEHVMKSPTVQDYIEQIRNAEEISKLSEDESISNAEKMMELTITTLLQSFPTVKREQFTKLTMEQLEALRGITESAADEEAPEGEETGKAS